MGSEFFGRDYTFMATVLDSVDIIVTTVSPNISSPAIATTATSASNNANSTRD